MKLTGAAMVAKTVLDVYGHLYEDLDRNAADALNPPWDRSAVDAMWTRRTLNRDQGREPFFCCGPSPLV